VKRAFARIKYFKNRTGARLYLPAKMVKDPSFPFEDDELIEIKIGNDSLTLEKPEWWEMLDWTTMKEAFQKLPSEIQGKIIEAGLAPS